MFNNVTRYSAAEDEALAGWNAAQEAPQASPQVTRVHTGHVRHTFNCDGSETSAEESTVARHTASFSGTPGGSVIATRQRQGAHDTVELVPGIPGSRTLLRTAIREGLVREVMPGIYEDVKPAGGQQTQQQQGTPQDSQQDSAKEPQQADPGAEVFTPDEDAAFAESIKPLPQFAYDTALASVTRAVVSADATFEGAARTLVINTGMSQEQAEQMVFDAYSHFERVVARALAPLKITADRFDAFKAFTQGKPRQLQEAIQALTLARDPSGFKALGAEFNRHHPAKG